MKPMLTAVWAAAGLYLAPFTFSADAAVEGTVKLPPRAAAPGPNARYKNVSAKSVAAPAPPLAVVYLDGKFEVPVVTNPPQLYQIVQKGFQFNPSLLAVPKGARVEFPNHDGEYHNVLSYSKAKEFDLGRFLSGEQPPAVVFDKAGVVELNCEIHEHMRAYILVLETPYFTTTDTEGRFRLEHLPAGHFTLKAWIGPRTAWKQPVDLVEGQRLSVAFPPP